MSKWTELNRAHWDERAKPHAESAEYGVERFATDPSFISDVVRFDVERLGDLSGQRGVHLQCHIGTDTLSLQRLGATMTGLDLSGASLEQARALAARLGIAADFVQGEVYDAPALLPHGAFDLVFTGIGALCWLDDIRRWAEVVDTLLAPGGRLFLREAHPMLWALADTRPDGVLAVEYAYFETVEPLLWDEAGSYVTTEHQFVHTSSANWNHGLGEVMTALLDRGLTITAFEEHDSVPWDALPGMMEHLPNDEYRLIDRPERLPHTYTLQARKPA